LPQRSASFQLLRRRARVAPAIGELRKRCGTGGAYVREDCGRLSAERRVLHPRGRGDPLHAPRAHAARRIEERGPSQLADRLAIHRGEGEANDFADGREVVRRESDQEREQVVGDRRLVVDHTRDWFDALGRVALAQPESHAHEPPSAERADDAGSHELAGAQALGNGIGECARKRHRKGDVGEHHGQAAAFTVPRASCVR
jgi:hypothetical protein